MKKILIIIGIVAVIVVGVIFAVRFFFGGSEDSWICQNGQWVKHGNPSTAQPTSGCDTSASTNQEKSWQEKGVAISGQYADSDIVDLGNGQYRLYYAVEPEKPGNRLEVYSTTSRDGINWTQESGVRHEFAVTPNVIKLPNGQWRMYFQSMDPTEGMIIKSAISDDGLNFTDEPGTRIDKNEAGYNLESVAAPATIQLTDGSYLMVYRGVENKKYQTSEQIPNNNTSYLFSATSNDGLTWQKKGLALDSRNETLYGLVDGPSWAKWDGSTELTTSSELRLYFWTYTGVYHIVYKDGGFSAVPIFDFLNQKNQGKFPNNPPCDPTLMKINNVWMMYYGQHTKGIYYATYQ